MDFKFIPKEYRPIPFWSWNDKLLPEETTDQINKMNDVGIGGFFMHARGGLKTEYLSEEWFENVEASIKAAKENGMHPWAYDENGWPSGFGSGMVNGLGIEYQQKYLRISKEEPKENVICKSGEHWFYFDVNPFYVDTLDKKVIAEFIKVAYQPYYERFGNDFDGFFTDEPQISRNGIPWSFTFDKEYKERYNENITDHLEELFLPVKDYKNTRVKFWKMVTDLFSNNFMKQIYDWCTERNLKFTGHMVLEEDLYMQITSNGATMPHYEYMSIPGMDWLGRNIFDCLTPLAVSSVSEQLGKDQILAETFALCGHNVSFSELKGIFEWQMVRGVNLLCQHLEGYSLRGIRKRDYPPAMYYQQPWWSEYKGFVDAMSRVGMILSKGKKKAKVLLLHPQSTAWTMYDDSCYDEIMTLSNDFVSDIKALEQKHIIFHLGDETIMERHARVENGKLMIGNQEYETIINTRCEVMLDSTKKLLEEFVSQGGSLIDNTDEIAANDICDNSEITYTKRSFDDFNVHYFVNTSKDRKTSKINVSGKALDIYSGELEVFSGEHEFEPWGSLVIIEDGEKNVENKACDKNYICLDGSFAVSENTINTITLDKCDYYFDGVLQEKNAYVLDICESAIALGKEVKLHQDYHIKLNALPKHLEMAVETPEMFKITINGEEIDKTIIGYFRDKSFKTIDITKYIRLGENTISFDCDFAQSEKFYENYKNSMIFESEKNKLAYDMEIEAIYLLGDFSVVTDGVWTSLDKNAVRYKGSFELDSLKKEIDIKNIEKQGFPFYAGEMTLYGEIDIVGENPVLKLDTKGINAVRIEINGIEKTLLTDNQISLKQFGACGKQKIKLTLVNNLRNLLGPHHLEYGESYTVCPPDFYKKKCVWNFESKIEWNDDYCFVEMGL